MFKRAFDLLVSGLGLLVLAPLIGLIALLVKRSSPGPVFYKARRVGLHGAPIAVYKFRSMVADADRAGPAITLAGDARITPIGRLLRRSKLDELPQLWNVFRGDMSLVGPRPEDPRYVALYSDEQRKVLSVRPGITSLASLAYRHEEAGRVGENWEKDYIEVIMPAKLAIDLDYVRQHSLLKDLTIILRTLLSLFR